MSDETKESLWDHFVMWLTNTKKPGKNKLAWAIMFIMIGFLTSGFFDFHYGKILEKSHLEPKGDVIMPFGLDRDHLPITIQNVGETPLTNVEVSISSCDMENFSHTYSVPDLEVGQPHIIEFKETKTIEEYKKLECSNIEMNYNPYWIELDVYITQDGKTIFPNQEHGVDVCGSCFYDIVITSEEFNKTFREQTYSTIQLAVFGKGREGILIPKSARKEKIKVAVFDEVAVERLNLP